MNTLTAIKNGVATLIGQGKWINGAVNQADAARGKEWKEGNDYQEQIYKYNGKFYAIVMYNQQMRMLMDETLTEVSEKEIADMI